MATPVVSVIMLTHNRGKYIGDAIASVLGQVFSDLELIILDDGSSDGTEQLVRNITDERIQYHRFDWTGQISRLRNLGIQNSRGEFIAFIDSDDVWNLTKLHEQMHSFKIFSNAGFGFCDVTEFKNGNTVLRSGIYGKSPDTQEYMGNIFLPLVNNQYVIYPSTAIFKKVCLETVGGINETLKPGETEFFTRLAYEFDCFVSYQRLVNIRKHEGNASDQLRIDTVSEMQFCLRALKSEGKISDALFRKMTIWYHYVGGMVYLEKKQYSQARGEFLHCLLYEPFHLKAWARTVLTFIQPLL